MKVILCGILGNMGARMLETCYAAEDVEVVAGVDTRDGRLDNIPLYTSFAAVKEKADVVVDFSNPALTEDIARYCETTHTPVVLCTTGQNEAQTARIAALSRTVPVFKSANMSIGIALLTALAKQAAALLGESFDIEIVEQHHRRKLDAPSGTALMLADAINAARGNAFDYVYDRHDARQARRPNEIGIHSVRGGTIVGEHEVIFAGNDEVLRLSHSASSRSLFATGALKAARYLVRQKPGIYDMDALVQGLQ